jgi:hypothetical protein
MKQKTKSSPKDPNRYPKGWDRKRVEAVITHYDTQSEAQAVAEDEGAHESSSVTMMAIPVELVPAVNKLIAKRAS